MAFCTVNETMTKGDLCMNGSDIEACMTKGRIWWNMYIQCETEKDLCLQCLREGSCWWKSNRQGNKETYGAKCVAELLCRIIIADLPCRFYCLILCVMMEETAHGNILPGKERNSVARYSWFRLVCTNICFSLSLSLLT